MCGISGFVIGPGSSLLMDKVDNIRLLTNTLLCETSSRGRDASGIAIMDKDGIVEIYKKPEDGFDLVQRDYYKQFINKYININTRIVILHARMQTKGSNEFNENNHPVIFGDWVAVHNGMIWNDDDYFKERNIKKPAEVDTIVIPMAIQTEILPEGELEEGKKMPLVQYAFLGLKNILCGNKLTGSYAFAAISPEYKENLFLARKHAPINTAFLRNEHLFLFGSSQYIIVNSLSRAEIDGEIEKEEMKECSICRIEIDAGGDIGGLEVKHISAKSNSDSIIS